MCLTQKQSLAYQIHRYLWHKKGREKKDHWVSHWLTCGYCQEPLDPQANLPFPTPAPQLGRWTSTPCSYIFRLSTSFSIFLAKPFLTLRNQNYAFPLCEVLTTCTVHAVYNLIINYLCKWTGSYNRECTWGDPSISPGPKSSFWRENPKAHGGDRFSQGQSPGLRALKWECQLPSSQSKPAWSLSPQGVSVLWGRSYVITSWRVEKLAEYLMPS